MTDQERQNKLTASLFRIVHLMTLANYEFKYFAGFKASSGVKNVLHRGIRNYESFIDQLKSYLPKSKSVIDAEMVQSEEKVHAIGNIIEKLFMLDEATVLKLEDDFNSMVKIDYSGQEKQ